MKTPANPLLVRDEVGKARPSVFDLPGQHHIYGKLIERDPEETTAQVLQHWNVRASTQKTVAALDYVTMNRQTVRQKIISPKEVREYHQSHAVRVKPESSGLSSRGLASGSVDGIGKEGGMREGGGRVGGGPLPSDGNKDFTYGKPTRPSTPVKKLMSDVYQREWIEEQELKAKEQEDLDKIIMHIYSPVTQEKTRRKHNKIVAPKPRYVPKKVTLPEKDTKTLFKLSKFQEVPPKISCWREDGDLKGHEGATVVVTRDTKSADRQVVAVAEPGGRHADDAKTVRFA
ncbi:hypothetical protein HK101_009286 [Irineochytrium annulatum]|nr:hypothetical protein HK101_009286 [Irineochytrium annulatum]